MNSLILATKGSCVAMPVDNMNKQTSCPAGWTLRGTLQLAVYTAVVLVGLETSSNNAPAKAAMDAADTATCGAGEGIGPIGEIERWHDGFRFTEGPADDGSGNLYFSDIPANRIYKVGADGKLSIFMEDSGGINGLMFDATGTLYACQGEKGHLVAIKPTTRKITVLADKVGDQPLGKPNDLVLDRHGGIYFTEPGRGTVYYRHADGDVSQFNDGIKRPNGVILSPDEEILYVIPSGQPQMMAYPITEPGKLGKPRVFCTIEQLTAQSNTGGDGATVDTEGNLYIATRAGVQIFDPQGKPLTIIRHEGFNYPKHPANVTFGGEDRRTLFITARDALYRVKMNAKGHAFALKSGDSN